MKLKKYMLISMVAVTLLDMLFPNMTARIDKIVDFYK